ncbi:hypothetical protein DL766_001000 [Monosporascus sp. MC13-8B]|uniref:Uncharacterized protein n=1 Tax=Monosporascus cannonballus TaxID=155416 RepID=A0ABY0H7W6_9PEZI|nr:hypothetical protein DL762_005915 [Monosporascus cannonballus]RYP38422.1 hypothetical protein DL766_001000 [Monosporascus sp. MC13-8B]
MSEWGNQESAGGKAGQQGGANTDNTGLTGPDFDPMYEQKRSNGRLSTARREKMAEQRTEGSVGEAFRRYAVKLSPV